MDGLVPAGRVAKRTKVIKTANARKTLIIALKHIIISDFRFLLKGGIDLSLVYIRTIK